MSEILPPWEQLQDEPARWYARFERFRLAGPARSVLATFNLEQSEKGRRKRRCVPGAWAEAAKRWRWRERADAWDDDERRKARELHAAKIKEMNERHAQMALGLQTKGVERLRALRPDELGPEHVVRFLAEATKLERQALVPPETAKPSESTDRGESNQTPRFSVEDAVAAARELEEAERDAEQRRGEALLPRSDKVP
jgi:hypothetical protein